TKIVRLRDIANVYDGLRKEESAIYVNGNPAVYIIVQKQTGTNSVKTVDNVKEKLKKIQKEVPYGIQIEVIRDTTKIIKNSLNSVINSVLTGAVLAILILFLFLRSFKSVTIIGIAIPISVVITLMLMYFFNLTLNIMTLSGLALGIGMLVDNSIVILENIFRYREKGAKHTVSSIVGAEEMMGAITGSTLTTVVVFAPVIMFKNQLGMIGELFSSLAFVVVISLLCSLAVATLLVPVLTSKYLKITTRLEDPLTGPLKFFDNILEDFWSGMSRGYEKALKFVLRHRKMTILIIFLMFVGSLCLIPIAGFEFIPQSDDDSVTLNVEMPIGTSLDITKSIMNQIELVVKKDIKGYKDIIVRCGKKGFFGFLGSNESHKGSIMITLPEFKDRIDTSTMVKQKLRKYFNDFPSAKFEFSSGMMRGRSSSPIDVIVKSNDLDKGKAVSEKIRDLIKKHMPEITEPLINLKDGLPQIEIKIDRDKAYSLGLNIYTIGQEIRANIDGITVSKFRESGSEYDILLIANPNDRDSLPDLEKIFVVNQSGVKVPLSNFAFFERTTGPVNINRENQTRVIHITGGIIPEAKLNEVEVKLRNLIKQEIPQDDAVIIDFSGDFAELMKYGIKFIMILIIAMALVFGVMAAQFESFLDPFIIFFTMPLTLIGVIGIHLLTGEKFSIYTAVGLVVLVGVVVNNGIVLLDYANLLRNRDMSIFDATVTAGGNRLRPILMTTLTTILGLLPMAFFKGEGTDLSQPLAKTMLGGLTVSTFFTLFLIPTIYSIFSEISDKRKVKKEAKRQRQLENRKKRLQERLEAK
ncbi:MAG TPA: efflux RND transporter permease subunit, partial [Spirochaetota bacterium]|nr:efflux RND transporter permease subunit [Spirochaetota bacterium]